MNYSQKPINHKLITTKNDSGAVTYQDEWQTVAIKSKVKGGWSRMYKDRYNEILTTLNSNKEIKVFIELQDSIKTDFTMVFNQVHLSKKLKCSRSVVTSVIKRLVSSHFMVKVDGIFKSNPNVYIPYKTPNENIELAQTEWIEIMKRLEDEIYSNN